MPNSYDLTRLLLGILIFWGIAVASYRGDHVTVDLVWSRNARTVQRAIDVFAALVTLIALTVFTWMFGLKVIGTRADNVATFDLREPVWIYYFIAWMGLASAIVLLILRTLRLALGAEAPGAGARRSRARRWSEGRRPMSTDAVAIIGFVSLFTLMMLRVPVGIAMGTVGVLGFGYLIGDLSPALRATGTIADPHRDGSEFAVIPLFLLMGAFASASGMSESCFAPSNTFLGHLRGGLGVATIAACGGFAAICGSSVATAATFSKVAYPEMRANGYPQSFATGVIAAAARSAS